MTMLLTLHITIALAGIISATLLTFSPTQQKLIVSYALAFTTLVSGVLLTIQHPAHLAQTCITGLAYFAVVGGMIVVSRRRLATQK